MQFCNCNDILSAGTAVLCLWRAGLNLAQPELVSICCARLTCSLGTQLSVLWYLTPVSLHPPIINDLQSLHMESTNMTNHDMIHSEYRFTILRPRFSTTEIEEFGEQVGFQCTVIMPQNSPVRCAEGQVQRRNALAQASASLEVCRQHHQVQHTCNFVLAVDCTAEST